MNTLIANKDFRAANNSKELPVKGLYMYFISIYKK
jgi:hypothetical protein